MSSHGDNDIGFYLVCQHTIGHYIARVPSGGAKVTFYITVMITRRCTMVSISSIKALMEYFKFFD